MYAIRNMLNMIWNVIQTVTIMDIIDKLICPCFPYDLDKKINEI